MPSFTQKRWIVAAVGSLILHIGLVSVVLVGRSFTAGADPQPAGAVEVNLIAVPTAPPAPPPTSAAHPPPVNASPEPILAEPDVEPVLDTQSEVLVNIAEEYTDLASAAQLSAPAPLEPLQAAPVEGNIVATVQAEQQWEGLVLAALERKKRYPAGAQWRGQEDTVQLKIVIDRAGKVLEAHVLQSKHFRVLDTEAEELARRASPLPAPPDSVPGDTIELVVPIEFFIRRPG